MTASLFFYWKPSCFSCIILGISFLPKTNKQKIPKQTPNQKTVPKHKAFLCVLFQAPAPWNNGKMLDGFAVTYLVSCFKPFQISTVKKNALWTSRWNVVKSKIPVRLLLVTLVFVLPRYPKSFHIIQSYIIFIIWSEIFCTQHISL